MSLSPTTVFKVSISNVKTPQDQEPSELLPVVCNTASGSSQSISKRSQESNRNNTDLAQVSETATIRFVKNKTKSQADYTPKVTRDSSLKA